jgi:nicotinate-nucleotide adenylyltransferase
VNEALFGGTFDPVHCGHLSAARAAAQAFALERIYFVPASLPPHKLDRPITAFAHRYAMVALACAGAPQFVPSLLEAPPEPSDKGRREPNYSIVTVRRVAAALTPSDRLYFLTGTDAFLDLPHWREWTALLDACDFIIVSRPGFSIAEISKVIPPELRAGPGTETSVPLRRSTLHLLSTVEADVSSSEIRRRTAEGKPLAGLVPDAVADYIQKMGLFLDEHHAE